MYSSKRNFSYYMINNVILGIIPFISLSIFSRILTPQDYGLYALYLVVGTAFSSLTNFGLPVAHEILYFEQKNYQEKKALTFSSIILIVLLSILLFLIVNFLDDQILRLIIIKNYSISILYLSCLSSLIFSLNFYFFNHYRNDKDGKSYMIYRSLYSIITLFISVYLIFIHEYSFEAFFISTLLCSSSFLIFFFIKFNLRVSHIKWNLIKSLIKISTPLLPKVIFGLIRTNYDRLLINNITTQSMVGVYDLGLKVSNQCTIIIQSLYNTYVPGFYDQLNKKETGYKTNIPKYIMKSFGIYFFALLSVAFFSYEIFHIITPEDFHKAINISSIISVTLAFNFFEYVPLLLFLKKTRLVTTLYITTSSIIFFLGVLFGLKYGIYGFLLSNLILSILSCIIWFKVYQNNLKLNWPIKPIIIIYVYLLISVSVIILMRVIEIDYIIRIIIKLLLLLSSVLITLHLKVFTKNDFKFLSDRIKYYIISKK